MENLILGALLKSFGELLKTYIMILQNAVAPHQL